MSDVRITISLTNEGAERLLELLPFKYYDSLEPKSYGTPEEFVDARHTIAESATGKVFEWPHVPRNGAEADSLYETLFWLKDERLPFQCLEQDKDAAYVRQTADDLTMPAEAYAQLPFRLKVRHGTTYVMNHGDPEPRDRVAIAVTEVSPHHGATKETLQELLATITEVECMPIKVSSKTTGLSAVGFMANRVAHRNTQDMKNAKRLIRTVLDRTTRPTSDHLYETDGIVILVK